MRDEIIGKQSHRVLDNGFAGAEGSHLYTPADEGKDPGAGPGASATENTSPGG
jgi:hypothetical protein